MTFTAAERMLSKEEDPMAGKRPERAIPDHVPSGVPEPIAVSTEFIAALRQAGVRDSVVTAVEKTSKDLAKSGGNGHG